MSKAKSLSFNNKSSSSIPHVMNNDFIFFGCWNNINCSKNEKTLNRNVVLELLKNLYSNMPIVLAGDNWYSQKIKLPKLLQSANVSTSENKKLGKFKFYPSYVLETGYKKLFEISNKVDIVLGNHDINPDKLNDFYAEDKCDQLGCMVKVQTDIISKMLLGHSSNTTHIQNIYQYNDVKLYVCKPHIEEKSKGIFFLYLNTNIFEVKDVSSIDTYRELVIRELIGKKIKLLFIVGHHPFFGLKKKKQKKTEGESTPKAEYIINKVADLYFKDDKVDEAKVEAINRFLNIFTKYKSIYLCADIHNFQICKLSSNLCMVICGSGGASRDRLGDYVDNTDPIPLKCKLNDNIEVTDMYVHDAYGFSKITYSNSGNKVEITYYKFVNTDIEYNIFKYILEYRNKSWSITPTKVNPIIITDGDFNTDDHCPTIRAEDMEKVDPLLATIDGKKCGTKKK
tara:strand:+ start:2805 stop:4163 length:1359 start_codon:yes stop_codon:yes gene_type:complete